MWHSVFPTPLVEEDTCLYPNKYSCLLCHRLIDHRYMGLFLWYSVPLIHVSFFCANTILFWSLQICSIKPRRIKLQLCSFILRISLAVWVLLWFYINFRIICSSSMKNVLAIMIVHACVLSRFSRVQLCAALRNPVCVCLLSFNLLFSSSFCSSLFISFSPHWGLMWYVLTHNYINFL